MDKTKVECLPRNRKGVGLPFLADLICADLQIFRAAPLFLVEGLSHVLWLVRHRPTFLRESESEKPVFLEITAANWDIWMLLAITVRFMMPTRHLEHLRKF
jgi:hypothetical protein